MFKQNIINLKRYLSNSFPIENKFGPINSGFVARNNTFFNIYFCIFCKDSVMTYENVIKGHKFICCNCKNNLYKTCAFITLKNNEIIQTKDLKRDLIFEIDWMPSFGNKFLYNYHKTILNKDITWNKEKNLLYEGYDYKFYIDEEMIKDDI